MTIEVPDELARTLARIAEEEHKSVQQLAIERLSLLAGHEHNAGSAAAALQAMQEPPHLNPSDVDELDAAIAAGRLPVLTRELFRG